MKSFLKEKIAKKIEDYKKRVKALEKDLANLEREELTFEVNIFDNYFQHIPWKKYTYQGDLENAIKKAIDTNRQNNIRKRIIYGECKIHVVLSNYGKIEIPQEMYKHVLDANVNKNFDELRKIQNYQVVEK